MWRSRLLSRLLFIAGALLLAKGSFSVYPFLISSGQAAEVSVVTGRPAGHRFPEGTFLFRLSLPRQNAHFTVVEGTSDTALRMGPGHLVGSPLPGAITGNSIIAGHRDTHFRVLKDVLIGDEIHINTVDADYIYRIVDIRIVRPTDTDVMRATSEGGITLITCYPFYFIGPAPNRYIVQARLVQH